jgi:hypothetical protein
MCTYNFIACESYFTIPTRVCLVPSKDGMLSLLQDLKDVVEVEGVIRALKNCASLRSMWYVRNRILQRKEL